MALIVEDGTNVADSNSYDTLANAQAYFDLKADPIVLTEASLINATQYLDITYTALFIPVRKTRDQSLEWPRYAFTDTNGFSVAGDIIPIELKTALYETAKLYVDGANIFNNVPSETDNLQSLTQSIDGAVSESKTWFSPTNTNVGQNIGQYLQNILKTSANLSVRIR
tara:strand:+ start:1965 stop:2468 length:504 start_codon:yes stop_codon:yes gene_type:complete